MVLQDEGDIIAASRITHVPGLPAGVDIGPEDGICPAGSAMFEVSEGGTVYHVQAQQEPSGAWRCPACGLAVEGTEVQA